MNSFEACRVGQLGTYLPYICDIPAGALGQLVSEGASAEFCCQIRAFDEALGLIKFAQKLCKSIEFYPLPACLASPFASSSKQCTPKATRRYMATEESFISLATLCSDEN
jgi:hypothetical protein